MSPTGPHIVAAPSQESSRLTELLVMTEKELFNTKSLLEAKVVYYMLNIFVIDTYVRRHCFTCVK